MVLEKINLDKEISFVESMVKNNGPAVSDYVKLDRFFDRIGELIQNGSLTKKDLPDLKSKFGEVFSNTTSLIGHANTKPYGYAGDFSIIDKMYTYQLSSHPKYQKWDLYFQQHHGPKIVRSRKTMTKKLFKKWSREHSGTLKILNLASGSCRDIYEFFVENPHSDLVIDCVDMDENAIAFAQQLNTPFMKKVTFFKENIFKFQPQINYDIIWSAGLFDYFDDFVFSNILNHYLMFLKPEGKLIVGNIHTRSQSKNIMDFFGWHLHHRAEKSLKKLALQAGASESQISIFYEEQQVNMFIQIQR